MSRIDTQINIIKMNGMEIPSSTVFLDMGCGNGDNVQSLIDQGYVAYGCDFQFKEGTYAEQLTAENKLRLIDSENYRLPFDDNTFDVVISDQVFEHVQNYDVTLAEINRVTREGGAGLHIFPSKHSFLEPHVHVPLGTLFNNRVWLYLWAMLGVRKRNQKGMSAHAISTSNHQYLVNHTNYLTKIKIMKNFQKAFTVVRFCENIFLLNCSKSKFFKKSGPLLPLLSLLYSAQRDRVVFTIK